MPLKYHSGEIVMKGDHVLLSGAAGVIEFVADPLNCDPGTAWYVATYGGGVMISQLERLGSVFNDNPEDDDELELVSRSTPTPQNDQ